MAKKLNFEIEQTGQPNAVETYTTAALHATSDRGLNETLNIGRGYALTAADTVVNMPEAAAQKAMDKILNALNDSNSLKAMLQSIDAAANVIDMMKQALIIASKSATVAANITDLVSTKQDGACVPSVKECTKRYAASIKTQLETAWMDAKQSVIDLYNGLICTNGDTVIDNVITSVSNILNAIEPYIDPLLIKHTGYTYGEIKYMCALGFQYVRLIQRISLGDTTEGMSKEDAQNHFKGWLADQTVILQQGFHLILLMDTVTAIKEQCQKVGTGGVANFEEFVNKIQAILDLWELLGITKDAKGLTDEDLKLLGVTSIALIGQGAANVAILAQNNVRTSLKNATATYNDVTANAQGQAANITGVGMPGVTSYGGTTSYTFNGTKINENKPTYIEVYLTLLQLPNISDISDFLDTTFTDRTQKTFSNGKKKTIFQKLTEIWDTHNNGDFEIQGTTGGVLRTYHFNITVSYSSTNVDVMTGNAQDLQGNLEALMNGLSVSTSEIGASLLNGISVDIDQTALDYILHGKVFMYDPIVQLIKVLLPIISVMKLICHLMENYRINKATVQNKAHKDLADTMRKAYQEVLGLKESIGLGSTNFFTVRTTKMANWCTSKFGNNIDKSGAMKISRTETLLLNNYIYTHYDANKANGMNASLSALKPTILWFDTYNLSLPESLQTYQDGTYNGLENVVYNRDNQEVYYDSSGRSTMASQIFRAVAHNEDPLKQPEDNTPDGLEGLEKFIDAITSHESDEFDGQLVIDIQDMNLCSSEELLDEGPEVDTSTGHAIIEFADEYTNGSAVQYRLNVKPGQSIDGHTIIAYAELGKGRFEPIRSIFDKGTVMSVGTDYFRLFPGSCKRHIIISDYEEGMGCDYNTDDIEEMKKQFALSGSLYNLLMNHMCYSGLPTILCNSNRYTEYNTSLKAFDSYISKVNDTINGISKQFEDKCSKKNMKKMKGNSKKIKKLSDDLLDMRKNLLSDVIKLYNNVLPGITSYGDYDYADCKGLAYGSTSTKSFKVGNVNYTNYYMSLMANLNMSDTDDLWTKRYHKLLSDIIANRLTYEGYNITELISEFNNLFKANINPTYKDPYSYFYQIYQAKTVEYDDVYKRIKRELIKSKSTKKAVNAMEQLDAEGQDDWYNQTELNLMTNKDNYTMLTTALQLANIFVYIKTAMPPNVPISSNRNSNNSAAILLNTANYNTYFRSYIMYEDDPYGISKEQYNKNQSETAFRSWLQLISGRTLSSSICTELFNKLKRTISIERNGYNSSISINQDNYSISTLIRNERDQLLQFWKKAINAYFNEYDMDKIISNFKKYAESMVENAEWPVPTGLEFKGLSYKHYLFTRQVQEDEKEDIDEIELDEIPETVEQPGDPEYDMARNSDINEPHRKSITIMDYKYWLVYFANATVVTLIPAFWSDGFDIPPFMVPLVLPAIYIPVCKPIYIKPINVMLVFGIAIRGIWPAPIILTLNLSSQDINALLPVMIAMQIVRDKFQLALLMLEGGIPKLAKKMINELIKNNSAARKTLDKYRTFSNIIKSVAIENQALIEQEFILSLNEEQDTRQIITRAEKLGVGPEPF